MAKGGKLYFMATNSGERDIIVSLTTFERKAFHIYPKQFDQAMKSNV